MNCKDCANCKDYDHCTGSKTEWANFEIWLDEVQICGYMGDDDCKLQFIGADGLECYDDFSKTNYVGETANTPSEAMYLIKWCLIQNFLETIDIRPELLKHMREPTTITYGADEFRIKLHINCSPLDKYMHMIDDVMNEMP